MDSHPGHWNTSIMETSDPTGRTGSTRRAFLAATAAAGAAGTLGPAATTAHAAEGDITGHHGPGAPIRPQPPEHDLRRLLDRIDARRIEATVMRLVQFGTRHTLSSQDDPARGIGAATNWVYDTM